jgi:alkylation response protein AidB-like acyl-CoA dehydrogenase
MTVDYALSRRTFGKPIASYQAIKHKCADMLCWVEGSRAAARYAAEELLAGSPGAARAVSIAKSYASDVCSRLAGEALQIHGGIGFTWEHDLHLYLRRIKANEVLFGGIADHRAEIAAALA